LGEIPTFGTGQTLGFLDPLGRAYFKGLEFRGKGLTPFQKNSREMFPPLKFARGPSGGVFLVFFALSLTLGGDNRGGEYCDPPGYREGGTTKRGDTTVPNS